MDNTNLFQYDLFSLSHDECSEALATSPYSIFFSRVASESDRKLLANIFERRLTSLPNTVSDKIRVAFPDVATMLYGFANNPDRIVQSVADWKGDDALAFYSFCIDALDEMLLAVDKYQTLSIASILNRAVKYVKLHLRPLKFSLIYDALSPVQLRIVDDNFHSTLASLHTRARNVISSYQLTPKQCVEIAVDPEGAQLRFRNLGSSSVDEIQKAFLRFYDFVCSVPALDERALNRSHFSIILPFLNPEQVAWVEQYYERTATVPLLFIIHAYYASCDERAHTVFALRNGFRGPTISRNEIAKRLGLSAERVRQILLSYYAPEALGALFEEYDYRYTHLADNVITPDVVPEYIINEEFGEQFAESVSPQSILSSLMLMLDGKIVKYHDHLFLCSDNFLRHFDIHSAFRAVDDVFDSRRTSPQAVTVRQFIDPFVIRYSELLDEASLVSIMSSVLSKALNVPLVNEPCLIMPQNFVVVEDEIIRILASKASPMTLRDIQKALMHKFPKRDFTRTSSIRSYIQRCDQIVPLGKTSTYALKEWGVNTLTIREHIFEIIDSSPEPLSINEIVKALDERGITRSWTNVYSTIFNDKHRAYLQYEPNLIGLATHQYPNHKLKNSD